MIRFLVVVLISILPVITQDAELPVLCRLWFVCWFSFLSLKGSEENLPLQLASWQLVVLEFISAKLSLDLS